MSNKPLVYISSGKHVKITFTTDYTTSRKGFELLYVMGKCIEFSGITCNNT